MIRRHLRQLVAVLALAPLNAFAFPVQIDYTIDIAETFGGFAAPAHITGRALYDTDASLTAGVASLLSHEITFNGSSHSAIFDPIGGTGHTGMIHFQDEVPYADPLDRVYASSYFGFELIPGQKIHYVGFTLEGPNSLLSSNQPVVVNPADFTNLLDGWVTFNNGDTCLYCAVHGSLTNVTFTPLVASVPEPATLGLAIGAFGLLFFTTRRRKIPTL
jgi:hypothetical protein